MTPVVYCGATVGVLHPAGDPRLLGHLTPPTHHVTRGEFRGMLRGVSGDSPVAIVMGDRAIGLTASLLRVCVRACARWRPVGLALTDAPSGRGLALVFWSAGRPAAVLAERRVQELGVPALTAHDGPPWPGEVA